MPKVRRVSTPATGTALWQHNCPETGNRVLRITVTRIDGRRVSQDYEVEPVRGGYNLHRLDNLYHLITYHIRIDKAGVSWCDCPDADNAPSRCNHCKHVRALRAALAREPF